MAGTGAVIVSRAGVRVLPDTSGFGSALGKYLNRVEARTRLNINLGLDEKKFDVQLQKLVAKAEKSARVSLPATLDDDAARRQLDLLSAHLNRAAPKVNIKVDVDRGAQIRKAISSFAGLASSVALTTLKIGAFAAVAGAAVSGVLSLTAAVGAMSAAIAVVPAVGVAVVAAFSAIKVGLSGFGDALKAVGDPEKFAQALEKLSPAARSVAREVERLQPALQKLRTEVQDALFRELTGQLTATANVLLGPVRAGMAATTSEAGKVARAILGVAREAASIDLVRGAFDVASGSITTMNSGIIAVVRGFRDLAKAALPVVTRIAQGAGDAARSFGEWLSRISESGAAVQAINDAFAVMRQFGDLLTQVGGIIHTVLSAATAEGTGLTSTLTDLLRSINQFLSAGEGREALVSVLKALREAGQVLAPVLESLAKGIGRVAEPAANIAKALGPGVTALIDGLGAALEKLGPGLEAVAKGLSDAFADPELSSSLIDLGQALTDVLIASTPLIPPLGKLATLVANVLSRNLTTAAPVISRVAEALGFLLDKAIDLADWVNRLANQFSRWLYWEQIGGLLRDVGQTVVDVARWFSDLGEAISSLELSDITSALSQAASAVGRWFSDLGSSASSGLSSFVDGVVAWFQALPGRILAALQALPQTLWQLLSDALLFAATAVGTGIGYIVGALLAFPLIAYEVGRSLGALLWQAITDAWTWATTAITTGIDTAIAWFTGLPARIGAAVASLGSLLAEWARSAWQWATTTAISTAESILAWAVDLPGRIVAAVGSLASSLGTWATNAWNSARTSTVSSAESILSWVTSLPGRIVSAIGNLGSLLMESGKALIRGFIDGITSMLGRVQETASGIVQSVKDFFPFSPAKRGPLSGSGYTDRSGMALARDFAAGITRGVPLVVSAARELTDAVNISGGSLTSGAGTTQAGGVSITQNIDARGADADSVITTSENRLLHALGR